MSSYIRRYNSKGPELLIDMVDQAAETLSTVGGLAPSVADALAVAITNKMAQAWGGQFIYFPKGNWNGGALTYLDLEERDWQIEREYNGTNRKEICTQYNISSSRLYQIIISVRLARARRNAAPSVP